MPERTPAQQAAISQHDRDLIVVAGAGSGKTYVLVERYLALLHAHPDWPLNALVAITFTKKAAQEMRDRVRQALEREAAQATAEAERERWSRLIAQMESARIDTIHGLCAAVLRANAAEAGVDPDFEVLDETQARLLLEEVIDDALKAIVEENDPAGALLAEVEPGAVHTALSAHIAADWPPDEPDYFAAWAARWATGAEAMLTRLTTDADFQAAAAWAPPDGWPSDESDKRLQAWRIAQDALAALDSAPTLDERWAALARLAHEVDLRGGSASRWGGPEILAQSKDILAFLRESAREAEARIGEPPGAADAHAARLLPLWRTLLARVQTDYAASKAADSLLDFNDLERLTAELLRDHPAVQARYRGAEFRHLLIDEFQDTNAVQWAIVQGLCPTQGGGLFVVGDPKQSIYAFRGADVSVFGAVQTQITGSGGGALALARSFRTHQPLVAGFNAIFGQILQRDDTSPVRAYQVELGEPMDAARALPPGAEPPLEFLLIPADHEAAANADDRRTWEAYALAQRLSALVAEARPIYDRRTGTTRPITFGDMALLFQSMTHVNAYEDVFKTLRLPFVTVAGRGFYARQEVWDVLNLLKALHNSADNLALAVALRSPLFGLSDDTLLALRQPRSADGERLPLTAALEAENDLIPADERPRVVFAAHVLRRLRSQTGRVTIAALLRAALEATGYLAVLSALPDGDRRRGNVEKLLAKAEEVGQVTLGRFTAYLDDLSAREVREGEALLEAENAVTLMTVHASKGLEFPLVALAESHWERQERSSLALLIDSAGVACKVYDPVEGALRPTFAYAQLERLRAARAEAERRRLLYVAATRAQDILLVSGVLPKPAKDGAPGHPGANWLGWLWDALDMHQLDLMVGSRLTRQTSWGVFSVAVAVAAEPPDEEALQAASPPPALLPLAATPAAEPPLAAPLRLPPIAQARHITATQIADLGAASYDDYAHQRFRRAVLRAAPSSLPPVTTPGSVHVSGRIIGEMVHRVLGWWPIPTDRPNFSDILQAYAWELGVVEPDQLAFAVDEAGRLLERTLASQVFTWIRQADRSRVYRELPFIYTNGPRVVHGVIDLLFQRPDGAWVLLDYKTSRVPAAHPDAQHVSDLLIDHARRYHLQIGVYAAAVQAQFGDDLPLEAHIHYIRYGQTVSIQAADWAAALNRLEDAIGSLLHDEEDSQ